MTATASCLHADASAPEIARMIRVDQAGEYGAKRIYAGQLAILGHTPAGAVIRHMAEQEEKHLATFNRLLAERRVRPTLLAPLWHAAGFALGAATALLGEKAAMACTVAVEQEIGAHYARQEEALGDAESELRHIVAQFRAEEMEHHDTGLAHGAEEAPLYAGLSAAIRFGTRCAIWLSSRI